jgi:hypothetical protein
MPPRRDWDPPDLERAHICTAASRRRKSNGTPLPDGGGGSGGRGRGDGTCAQGAARAVLRRPRVRFPLGPTPSSQRHMSPPRTAHSTVEENPYPREPMARTPVSADDRAVPKAHLPPPRLVNPSRALWQHEKWQPATPALARPLIKGKTGRIADTNLSSGGFWVKSRCSRGSFLL